MRCLENASISEHAYSQLLVYYRGTESASRIVSDEQTSVQPNVAPGLQRDHIRVLALACAVNESFVSFSVGSNAAQRRSVPALRTERVKETLSNDPIVSDLIRRL